MKTIGVIGGFGPQATMEFEQRLHREAQRRIPPDGIRGYPPMVVQYHRSPPVLTRDDGTPVTPFQVDPAFLRGVGWLRGKADFVVIAANAPHMFRREIEEAAGCPVLSMIEATLEEVKRRGCGRVGVLGFGDARVPVYTGPLGEMGLATEAIGDALQARLNAAILRLAEGREDDASRAAACEAVAELRARGTDCVILGCTEIPPLVEEAPDLVNPLRHLAEAAVERAIG